MEYKYKLLLQFTMTVGGTRCYLWLKLTAGLHEEISLVSRNRTEQQWLKGFWMLEKCVPT